MDPTGERYIPETMEGRIKVDHLNRYYFAANIADLSSKTILDIASGSGYGSYIISEHAEHVYGVDISQEAIEYSQEHYNKTNLTFIQGDACKIPLKDRTIDMVISFETIEHTDAQETMISEIKRVLKPDGFLIISSPNKKTYSDEPNYHNPFHKKELYTNELVELLHREFKSVILFEQNYHIGSTIYPAQNIECCAPSIVLRENHRIIHPPMYDIAIAYDEYPRLTIPAVTSYLEDSGQISISEAELSSLLQKERQSLKDKSISWKLGNAILFPFLST